MHVSQQAEIAADNPHHGPRAVGAAAAHAALAKLQGADAEAVMARYTAPEDVLELPGHCSACGTSCATRMYQTCIPFFKVQSLAISVAGLCVIFQTQKGAHFAVHWRLL